ncbi:unnamed protein product, partial [Phaeothamnion confervicola]
GCRWHWDRYTDVRCNAPGRRLNDGFVSTGDRSTWPRRTAGAVNGRVPEPAAAAAAAVSPAAVPWAVSAVTTQQPVVLPQQVAPATAGTVAGAAVVMAG